MKMKKLNKLALSFFPFFLFGILLNAQTNNYFGTSGTLSLNVWSTNVGGPYNSAFVTTGGGIANFNNAGSFTGGTIVFAGINASASLNGTASGTISNFGNGVITVNISNSAVLDFAGQSWTSSGTAGYIKTGNGTWALAGNTYGGGFTLNDGIVIVRGVNALGQGGSLTINGGTLASNANRDLSGKYVGGITIGGDFTIGASTGLASNTATLTFTNNMALGSSTSRTITLGNDATHSFQGIISGSNSSLTISATGTGTLSLTGTNTYNGGTTINSGTLALGSSGNVLANTGSVNVNGGILSCSTFSETIGALTLTSGSITGTSGTLTPSSTTASAGTISKIIGGTGTFTKNNSGTVTLSGANTYSGGTTINSGILQLGATNVLANAGQIILSGGTLRTGASTGFSETVGTLELTASSTIALGTGNHTLTFANSSAVSWTAGQTLTITGWTGTAGSSGTAGKIVVGTGGLTTAQLAQVSFTGYSSGAAIVSGELVPVAPPSIAISSAHPAASNFPLNSTDNIVAGFRLDVTNNDATLNSVSVNTSGTYQSSDIQVNGFKFWINSTNDLVSGSPTQLGSNQAVVVSGGLVTVNGLGQVIASGTTQYILFTADIGANAGRTIGITTTSFANITFSAGTKTGTNPVPASNASSLPIKLISFNATRQNNQAQLTFSTATEENNNFFSIERSGNGTDFRTIGKVNGAGTTTSIQNYTFTDETPLSGINYYRLKQVDFDGQFSYSPVVNVVFDNKSGIRLAPTPVQDQLRVELEEMFQDDAQWQLYDFAGRLVQTGVLSAENMVFNVEVGSLTPGNYVIRVVSGQTTLTKQFQK